MLRSACPVSCPNRVEASLYATRLDPLHLVVGVTMRTSCDSSLHLRFLRLVNHILAPIAQFTSVNADFRRPTAEKDSLKQLASKMSWTAVAVSHPPLHCASFDRLAEVAQSIERSQSLVPALAEQSSGNARCKVDRLVASYLSHH
eukprot:scaffold138722_cov37-Tisochrysis_lutea.AAC.2